MAAGGFTNIYEFESLSKRKRCMDDDDDYTHESNVLLHKRRNIAQLPIRSPPRPSISVTPAFGQFSVYPGTLTPDSIPEDDGFQSNPELGKLPVAPRPHSNSNTSSTDSTIAQVDSNSVDNDDTEMDISSPKQANRQIPTPVRIGRARSNDLMSPVRSPVLIPPSPSRWSQDRIPTPMASRFPIHSPFESSFASAAARQLRPHLLQTTLSPMVDAESWTPQIQRPPSPGPESELGAAFNPDADSMMEMDDSNPNMMSSSFSGLSVHSSDMYANPSTLSHEHRNYQNANHNLQSSPTRMRSSQTSWASYNSSEQAHRGLGLDGTSSTTEDEMNEEEQTSAMQNGAGDKHTRNQSGSGRTARLHMGFRADCEKCVARVPGHYSHIIWT